jgi:twin arginine-targeting protein translocase, TatA/E family
MLTVYPLFIGTWEIILIVLVILLIFGGKKIPESMKALGKGIKSFKEGMNEIDEQINQSSPSKPDPKSEETPKSE